MTTAREELYKLLDSCFKDNDTVLANQLIHELTDAALAEARAEGYATVEAQACNFEHIRMHNVPYCSVCNSHERKWSKG